MFPTLFVLLLSETNYRCLPFYPFCLPPPNPAHRPPPPLPRPARHSPYYCLCMFLTVNLKRKHLKYCSFSLKEKHTPHFFPTRFHFANPEKDNPDLRGRTQSTCLSSLLHASVTNASTSGSWDSTANLNKNKRK